MVLLTPLRPFGWNVRTAAVVGLGGGGALWESFGREPTKEGATKKAYIYCGHIHV